MARYEPMVPTEQERSYTPEELADKYQVSKKTVLRLFDGEEGVLKLRPRGDDQRRPRYLIRIPYSVAARVFRRLAVRRPGKVA